MCFVDCFRLDRYHNGGSQTNDNDIDATFKASVKPMVYCMMHNNLDAIECNECNENDLFTVESLPPPASMKRFGSHCGPGER